MRVAEEQAGRFEAVAARVLGIGVTASAVLLVIGLILWGVESEPWDTRVLKAGLLVLMATPAARVVVSLIEYARARDWFFVATTLGVLLVLAGALLSALAAR